MNLLLWAVRFILTAFGFYTIAVWAERFSGRLKPWHVVFFWLGLIADTAGTGLMKKIAGRLELNIHSTTGLMAIVLMFIHTVWATVVLRRGDERAIVNFHKFSVIVWLIWMIPFLSGIIIGLQR